MHTDYMTATIVVDTGSFVAKYRGGLYIDLFLYGADEPYDVINVWDYAKGKARIPMTAKAVMRELARMRPDDARLDPDLYY